LFSEQETSIRLVKHEETKSIVGLKLLVFDLQLVRFLFEGVRHPLLSCADRIALMRAIAAID
jgi:hypothetical protein